MEIRKNSLKRLVFMAALSLGAVLLFMPAMDAKAYKYLNGVMNDMWYSSYEDLMNAGHMEDSDFNKTFTFNGQTYTTVSKERFKQIIEDALKSNRADPALVGGVIPLTNGSYVFLSDPTAGLAGEGWSAIGVHDYWGSRSQEEINRGTLFWNKQYQDVAPENLPSVTEAINSKLLGAGRPLDGPATREQAVTYMLGLSDYYALRETITIDPNSVPTGVNTGPFQSWIRGKDMNAYKNNPLTAQIGEPSNKSTVVTKASTAEKWLGEVAVGLGAKISDGLSGNGAINASTMGVILGKPAYGNSYFVFDLTDHNIYGIAGAVIYYVLRIICMTLMFLIVLWVIIKTLWQSSQGRGFSELKSVIYSSIIVMILLFIMPQIVDWVCNARDVIAVALYQAMTGNDVGGSDTGIAVSLAGGLLQSPGSIEQAYYTQYLTNGMRLADAIVYLAICCIPIFYIVSYVKIALQQLVLFGLFPVFAVSSLRDKSIMPNWLAVFISNCFIPTIDTILILVPLMLKRAIDVVTQSSSNFVSAVIIIVAMIGAIPVRNMILKMFGNTFGLHMLGGGEGFAAIAGLTGMAMAAGRGAFSSITGGLGGGNKGGIGGSDKITGDDVKNSDRDLGEAAKSLATETKSLGDINRMMNDVKPAETAGKEMGELPAIAHVNNEGMEGTAGPLDADVAGGGAENVDIAADPNGDNMPGAYEGMGNNDIDPDVIERTGDAGPLEPDGGDGEGATLEAGGTGSDGPGEIPEGAEGVENTKLDDIPESPESPEGGAGGKGDDAPDAVSDDAKMPTVDLDDPARGEGGKPDVGAEGAPESNIKTAEPFADGHTESDMRAAAVGAAAVTASNAAFGSEVGRRLDHEFGAASGKELDAAKQSAAKAADGDGNKASLKANMSPAAQAREAKAEVYNRRAANLASLDNLHANQQRLDDSTSAAKANISDARSRIAQNNIELQQHKDTLNLSRQEGSSVSPGELAKARSEMSRLNKDNLAQNKVIADNERVVARNDGIKKQEQAEIKQRQDVEQRYAKAFEQAGMSGQKHDSVEGFRQAIAHENRKLDNVSFKNFNTKENQQFLTKRETERYQAQYRARVTAGKVVGGVAGAVAASAATMAVGAVATGAAAFGGEQSMRTVMNGVTNNIGAVAGSGAKLGSLAGQGVGRGAGAVKDRASQMLQTHSEVNTRAMETGSKRGEPTSGQGRRTRPNRHYETGGGYTTSNGAATRSQSSNGGMTSAQKAQEETTTYNAQTAGKAMSTPAPGGNKPSSNGTAVQKNDSSSLRRNNDPRATGSSPKNRDRVNQNMGGDNPSGLKSEPSDSKTKPSDSGRPQRNNDPRATGSSPKNRARVEQGMGGDKPSDSSRSAHQAIVNRAANLSSQAGEDGKLPPLPEKE